MLAVLSVRFTDQPQRWAVVPAFFMGVSGLLLVAFGSGVSDALQWVWPPALVALAIWMTLQARRQLHSRTRRWLLYPVIAVMALASVGGGLRDRARAPGCKRVPDAGPADRRRRTQVAPSLHRLREPHGGAAAGRRRHVFRHGVDSAGGRRAHPSLRLRPGRSRVERALRRHPGRRADDDRPAHAAAPRPRAGSLRAGRSLLRWPVCPHLRRPLPQ